MQQIIPFPASRKELIELQYSDNIYAWLLCHSYKSPKESHSYIYANSFTISQIATETRRNRHTVSKRLKFLIDNRIIEDDKMYGEKVYIIRLPNPFQKLHAETVMKLLILPMKDQREEIIKTLAFLVNRNEECKDNNEPFCISSKEIIKYFNHSVGNIQAYDRYRAILTVLQGAGILKFRTIIQHNNFGKVPIMEVYQINPQGKASQEWLGIDLEEENSIK